MYRMLERWRQQWRVSRMEAVVDANFIADFNKATIAIGEYLEEGE